MKKISALVLFVFAQTDENKKQPFTLVSFRPSAERIAFGTNYQYGFAQSAGRRIEGRRGIYARRCKHQLYGDEKYDCWERISEPFAMER